TTCSLGNRTCMIVAKPIYLNSGTSVSFVAPAHATVDSSFAKLVTPSTAGFVTCCAPADAASPNHTARESDTRLDIQPPGRKSSYEAVGLRQRTSFAPMRQKATSEAVSRPQREDAEDHADRDDPVAGDVVLAGRGWEFHSEVAHEAAVVRHPEPDVQGNDRLHDRQKE